MSAPSQAKLVESFQSITSTDAVTARWMLEVTAYNLEQAVDLFFNRESGAAGPPADEQLAQQLANEGLGHSQPDSRQVPDFGAENVRAPIPARLDRLYGDAGIPFSNLPMLRGNAMRPANHEVEAFRDFEAESGRRASSEQRLKSKSSLGAMFEPPKDLIFKGDFEQAKSEALDKCMWLLLNLQSNTEFASHLLNRDTWGDSTMQDILKGSFIFLQVPNSSSEGQKIQANYKLYDLPAIVVIDPITGSAMRTFTGFSPPERLMEELVPFMDHSPEDPQAHRLGMVQHKRKFSQAASVQKVPSEEEEMEMALKISMQDTSSSAQPEVSTSQPVLGQGQGHASSSSKSAEEQQLAASTSQAVQIVPQAPQKPPEEIQADALASLPPEPLQNDRSGTRVAVRLPEGGRSARRFPRNSSLGVLRAFCIACSPEAATGRAFHLVLPQPGAGQRVLSDLTQTLEAAGVADSLVSMMWT